MSDSRYPSEEEVESYFDRLSNWGRWGENDELGTLNLITPQKIIEALRVPKHGVAVGCARPIIIEPPASDVPRPPLHFMITTGEGKSNGARDFLGFAPHGLTITHVDALSHVFRGDTIYNGYPKSDITEAGAPLGSVEVMKNGVVTRGVLVDVPRHRGVPYLEAGEAILPGELDEILAEEGVSIGEGDALLLRTGWYERREERGPYDENPRARPGLQAAALPWLHEKGVSVVASDAAEDVFPSGYPNIHLPIHTVGIAAMGLCLLDNCQFEDLSDKCHELNSYEFLLTMAPLRFRNATGSPLTPLAVL